MKKNLLLLVLVFPFTLNAQFTLTKEGFVSTNDTSKKYVVFTIDDISKEDLYTNVLRYITSIYVSAKDVVSKVDNEVITINGIQPQQIKAKTLNYDIHYSLTIQFRDGRIRIDSPTFECSTFAYGKKYRLTMTGSNAGFGTEVTVGLFKKNGEPGQKNTIKEIEQFFNILTKSIKDAAENGNNNQDDW